MRGATAWSVAGVVLIAAAATIWATWGSDEARDDARRLWESREPATYSFELNHCAGLCDSCPVRITVVDGRVASSESVNGRCAAFDRGTAPTVEGLFAAIETERDYESTEAVSVQFDPDWGFPRSIEVRCAPGTPDCGASYEVSGFRAGP